MVQSVVASDSTAVNDASIADSSADERNNLISRTVDELYDLLAQSHELREDLIAHGVTFHMLNTLVELGVHDKLVEQAKMMETALQASITAHGSAAITADELASGIEAIVVSDKNTRHLRHVAKQQGVHMQALNHLTQLMRLNPGDRGQQAVNTLVAYADASGIKLDQVQAILARHQEESKSVLPQIEPEPDPDRLEQIRSIATDVAVGLVITSIVMWMVL